MKRNLIANAIQSFTEGYLLFFDAKPYVPEEFTVNNKNFVSPDQIRKNFSRAMSEMYQEEVPLYGNLMALVSTVNTRVIETDAGLKEHLQCTGEIQRLDMERHGAIRVGTAAELATIGRLFAVMGMEPVGYYDLTVAGVPVHSTAFRAVHEASLEVSPFRVFTSLLRLELIDNPSVRDLAATILAKRNIFTPRALALIELTERQGGLDEQDAKEFIEQSLETFRWHRNATVTAEHYQQLNTQHRLVADVVAFKGPHINHLTPRTLDIDAVQAQMPGQGITPKAVIEGPPRRDCPILLRQTSFKALEESVAFTDQPDRLLSRHSARFGEIEQRGAALTPKGRALYDRLLNMARDELGEFPNESNAQRYTELLGRHFESFPDTYAEMREQGLAYFRYFTTQEGLTAKANGLLASTLEGLVESGHVRFEALVYEDFLPVSAAGIFQSNLGEDSHSGYASSSALEAFNQALGLNVIDELKLYAETQHRSQLECFAALGLSSLMVD